MSAAEVALRDGTPVNYALPFAPDERRVHRIQAFLRACDAGQLSWCWMAMEIAPKAERPALEKRVEANCRAGDLLSCRALPSYGESRFPDLPGAAGRSEACEARDGECDFVAVRTECAAGFPRSCLAATGTKPPPSDRKALLARYDSLSEAGCSAWILDECNTYTEDPAKQRLQETRPCDLTGSCNTIGRRAKDAGQALAARDAYERGCQYDLSDSHRCYGIGTEYLDHRWPEPVPGRGQALIDWECMTWEKTLDKGESIVDMLPECKRMTPHQ